MIAIIDYGMGNLRSVQKALEIVGAKTKLTSEARDIEKADKIVFPGVGAFGEAMAELKKRKLVDPLKSAIGDGKIFLGLCLGLQLLFEKSEEDPGVKGLCVLEGESKRFKFKREEGGGKREVLKVPHMGWNSIKRTTNDERRATKLLAGIPNGSYMYFVHSYYVKPKDKTIALTTTDYGIDFVSGIHKDNIYAFQFHPEKSQGLGLKILENFVRLK
jgi:imidazole glycerol-phosphate synthase subunit HisH